MILVFTKNYRIAEMVVRGTWPEARQRDWKLVRSVHDVRGYRPNAGTVVLDYHDRGAGCDEDAYRALLYLERLGFDVRTVHEAELQP